VIYTRVSSEEQEREGLSLAAQLADCRRYVAAHSWVIAAEHQDVMSGRRDDRPSYQALLADVRRLRREGQNVIVVVKWLHRLGPSCPRARPRLGRARQHGRKRALSC
jgi:DNA invertase Pin-like site-specific DNA recombinase